MACGREGTALPLVAFALVVAFRRGVAGRLGRPAGVGDGGSSSRNQGGNALPLLQVHSGLVEVLLEADEHIPNLGWRTQFEYRVGNGVVAKDQER